jgi:hypothetical protein
MASQDGVSPTALPVPDQERTGLVSPHEAVRIAMARQ